MASWQPQPLRSKVIINGWLHIDMLYLLPNLGAEHKFGRRLKLDDCNADQQWLRTEVTNKIRASKVIKILTRKEEIRLRNSNKLGSSIIKLKPVWSRKLKCIENMSPIFYYFTILHQVSPIKITEYLVVNKCLDATLLRTRKHAMNKDYYTPLPQILFYLVQCFLK